MMTRYHGNDSVKGGFYWRPSEWEIVTVPREGGTLLGTADMRYVRLPVLLILVLGPFMGALYVVFLPFIGFAMLLGFAGHKLLGIVRSAMENLLWQQQVSLDDSPAQGELDQIGSVVDPEVGHQVGPVPHGGLDADR
jgi:hypothetical protein